MGFGILIELLNCMESILNGNANILSAVANITPMVTIRDNELMDGITHEFGAVFAILLDCICCFFIIYIANALEAKEYLIAAVDSGELTGDMAFEAQEDITVGEIPDHTVVVLSYNDQEKTITIYDPGSPNAEDTYPIEQFIDAWNDSKNYLVTINTKEMKTYNPKPIDITDVVLTEDLDELREAIAENAHEVWAANRMAEGWSYGPQRDDNKKENPCMVPYSQLPESEKDFDRNMAMNTIKLLKKLGYDLIKREDTELYKILKERIKNSQQEFHCPKCKAVIYKKQVFCDKCCDKIDIDWSLYE